ncbi:hypothetical protein LENED_006079 [Lentinula edodes]|uniref:Uncharacterized protein n=2 Tax=Lentinula edodes TaxID=5353 RepID=A0A1Q3EAS5_LENED|nr:hypothetical protein LENED_006079 [Lentinula edodes]
MSSRCKELAAMHEENSVANKRLNGVFDLAQSVKAYREGYITFSAMASNEEVILNAPHQPHPNSLEAFGHVLQDIKHAIIHSRRDWDKHEPKMWSRASGISDQELVDFTLEKDLVVVRSAPVSYGTIILGKIRIPAINDDEGEGFIHVRIHDPPNRGTEDVKFHSIFTDEGNKNADGQATTWRAVQTKDTPLEFFNE